MKRTFIKDLKVCEEEKVLLRGWVHKIRDLASVTFVMLRDKSGIINSYINDCSKTVCPILHRSKRFWVQSLMFEFLVNFL